jgi:hypothetical protein
VTEPDPEKWWQHEIPADLEIARDAAREGDTESADKYAYTALWQLWDLHHDRGDAGVLAMLEKLDRDGLVRLLLAAVTVLDARNFDRGPTSAGEAE